MSAEMTLANERHCQKVAKHGTTLGEKALAKEQRCSLLEARAAELGLAAAQVTVSADLADLTDSALPKLALAKNKRRQEEAAAEQCRADNKRFMALVMLPELVDVAIRRIWANCTLRAAPLDTILAKIACNNIAHEAQVLPTATLPHLAAMLSIPPRPMAYVGMVLSMMGGNTRATFLALAPSALPPPTVDGQLWTVRQCARPCWHTGCCYCPRAPSPPDAVLPSHSHPTLGGLPTSTKSLTTLARATLPCCSVVSSPPTFSTTSPTPSLLPFTFSSKVLLSLEEGTTHPFCVGNPPPQKRT